MNSTPEQETETEVTTELNEPKGKSTPSNIVFFALGLLAAIILASTVILLKRKK